MLSAENLKSSMIKLKEHRPRPAVLLVWAAMLIVLAWSYGVSLVGLTGRWWSDPDYLYGFLVPVFAAVLLWVRREKIPSFSQSRGSWWGLVLIAVAVMMRLLSAYYCYQLLDPLSLIPCLAGIALFVGGWPALRWAWPAVVFLVFMVPLPGHLAGLLSHKLQRIGTILGTYVVQTVGIPAVASGNVIALSETELGVEEACSGLPNMMLFFSVCVGAAFLLRRTLVEKILIVLSAAPIAVVANVIRIAVTAILYETAGEEWGHAVFHDLAGWFMMPLAVGLLWLELAILDWILVERRARSPVLLEDITEDHPRAVVAPRT